MLTTSRPGSAAAGVTHARTARPSTWTVHAPHWATPHPYFVPVRVSSSRSTHSSGTSLSTSTVWLAPLIVNVTIVRPPACYVETRTRALPGRRQAHELPFQRVDLCQVAADVVVAAPLAGGQPEAAARVGVARPAATEMDDGGQILFLLERRGGDPLASHRRRDTAIEEGGGHLDGVARHDARVETVEPARSPLVPGTILDDHMVVDAVALGLPERRVGDLYIPTALEAGRYISNGFHVRRHRQYVRATGLPAPSTWASAASRSGVMTGVECSRKSGAYCRQVSGGVFDSTPLTGKNSSVGLRTT